MPKPVVISRVKIENFKCFKGVFSLDLNPDLNILVGDNEAGKSTILEAIHIALSGIFHGRYLKNDLNQYLFNHEVVADYIKQVNAGEAVSPPHLSIELFLKGADIPKFEGNNNSEGSDDCGLSLTVKFDENYQSEYEELVKGGEVKTLPVEYYEVAWESFGRELITPRTIPLKSAFIDSSGSRSLNGSDMYISRIIQENLDPKEIVNVSQAHRKMREEFMGDAAIQAINKKIQGAAKITDKKVRLSVDLSSRNAWESTLVTYIDDVPFHFCGKGEQSIIKTKMALSHKKSKEANLILLEEPENHLSHTRLSSLISDVKSEHHEKQVIISTHNSFVANKLGLKSLIMLNDRKTTSLSDLDDTTGDFFEKISGYDTLRLVLCKKAILVEGDSDELVVQKAYMLKNSGRLPIEDGVEVISVGTAFLRFLEIADEISKQVCVVTDNDGDVDKVKEKYKPYESSQTIKVCFDETVDSGELMIGDKKYNYNTLEPKLLKSNSLDILNKIFGTSYNTEDELRVYMRANKTECALKIFKTDKDITFPQYILDAIED